MPGGAGPPRRALRGHRHDDHRRRSRLPGAWSWRAGARTPSAWRAGELLYTGAVRTPVEALASHVRVGGASYALAAEGFATSRRRARLARRSAGRGRGRDGRWPSPVARVRRPSPRAGAVCRSRADGRRRRCRRWPTRWPARRWRGLPRRCGAWVAVTRRFAWRSWPASAPSSPRVPPVPPGSTCCRSPLSMATWHRSVRRPRPLALLLEEALSGAPDRPPFRRRGFATGGCRGGGRGGEDRRQPAGHVEALARRAGAPWPRRPGACSSCRAGDRLPTRCATSIVAPAVGDAAAHWMAVLAMDQYAEALVAKLPRACRVETLDEARAAPSRRAACPCWRRRAGCARPIRCRTRGT